MRRALAIVLMAVLVLAPCSSMNIGQALASQHSVATGLATHVGGHLEANQTDAGQTYDRASGNSSGHSHHDSTDCLISCSQSIAQAGVSDDLMKVVVKRAGVAVLYFEVLASADLQVVSNFADGFLISRRTQTLTNSMSVLDRTTRLRI